MTRFNVAHWLKALLCVVIFPAVVNVSLAVDEYARPSLKITRTEEGVAVSWPIGAYYYTLATKPNLSSEGGWTFMATAARDFRDDFSFPAGMETVTNYVGRDIVFPIATTDEQAGYALVGPRHLPIFQFAIFYQDLLEFSITSDLRVNGPVHANGDIYTGTGSSLQIYGTVVTAKAISSPAWAGQGPKWADTGSFYGNPQSVTNAQVLALLSGTNAWNSYPFRTNLHGMIETPPASENTTSIYGTARIYNQAHVVVMVSNTTTTVKIQNGSVDVSPLVMTAFHTNFPFLNMTNKFTDQRENKIIKATQIDLGLYNTWLSTNPSVSAKFPVDSGSYPTILYIADNRTNASSTMSAIRITNGIAPPYNGGRGFTLVTPNPLYVWGNYNCTNVSHLAKTNTSSAVPSALICDALTILSDRWKDSLSAGSLSSRTAGQTTTINAAIITGNVPSTDSSATNFSGGVQNLPRLLENWSASTLWLNTSLVCVYKSVNATNKYQNPGAYFNPPTRKFSLDRNFIDPAKIPPGCPVVGVMAPLGRPW